MIESYWSFTGINHRPTCANCNSEPLESDMVTPYCPWCGAKMTNYDLWNCSAYREEYGRKVCYGTKEREECSCGGDQRKCNFYKELRGKANGKTV